MNLNTSFSLFAQELKNKDIVNGKRLWALSYILSTEQ